jgi:ribonucleoside-diphosphate reductase alpha chain
LFLYPQTKYLNPFLNRIWEAAPDVYAIYKKYGRRNIANTTTAPTGSVSTLTQTTSGIEPAYSLLYKRRKKINPGDGINTRVDFVDQKGDKWQEFFVFHHQFKEWMDVNGYKIDESEKGSINSHDDLSFFKKSPYYKATSNDVDWSASVDIQSVAQKWIDHAISKTCNLPNDVTKELVADVYMKAWEAGCKGFTVYRDGCRTGVLVSASEKKKENIQKTNAPKRPQVLDCDIHHTKSRGEDFFVLVGIFEGHPYEVFAGKNGCITTLKKGTLTKKKRGEYELKAEDGSVVQNVCDLLTDEQAVITRMISLSLRHGGVGRQRPTPSVLGLPIIIRANWHGAMRLCRLAHTGRQRVEGGRAEYGLRKRRTQLAGFRCYPDPHKLRPTHDSIEGA